MRKSYHKIKVEYVLILSIDAYFGREVNLLKLQNKYILRALREYRNDSSNKKLEDMIKRNNSSKEELRLWSRIYYWLILFLKN